MAYISDDEFKHEAEEIVGKIVRVAVLREREACAKLVRSISAQQELQVFGEIIAENIEARP